MSDGEVLRIVIEAARVVERRVAIAARLRREGIVMVDVLRSWSLL